MQTERPQKKRDRQRDGKTGQRRAQRVGAQTGERERGMLLE